MSKRELVALLGRAKTNWYAGWTESDTVSRLVLPQLRALGWRQSDISQQDHVGNCFPDITLSTAKGPSVLVEVKRLGHSLSNANLSQVCTQLKEAQGATRFGFVTNGLRWVGYFVAPYAPEHEPTMAVDVDGLRYTPSEVATRLATYLSRSQFEHEQALYRKFVNAATRLQLARQAENELADVWAELVRPDQGLVDLFNRKLASLSGGKVRADDVRRFLESTEARERLPESERPSRSKPTPIKGIHWGKHQAKVETWNHVIPMLLLAVSRDKSYVDSFESTMRRLDSRTPLLSVHPKNLRSPERIGTTPWYVEKNVSADRVQQEAPKILAAFDKAVTLEFE